MATKKQNDKTDSQQILSNVFIRAVLMANRLNEDQPEELQIENCINIAKAIAQTGIVTPESLLAENIGTIAEEINTKVESIREKRKHQAEELDTIVSSW